MMHQGCGYIGKSGSEHVDELRTALYLRVPRVEGGFVFICKIFLKVAVIAQYAVLVASGGFVRFDQTKDGIWGEGFSHWHGCGDCGRRCEHSHHGSS